MKIVLVFMACAGFVQGMKISNLLLENRVLLEHSLSIANDPIATLSYELSFIVRHQTCAATIKNLYVYPHYRKKGYGQFLVISALQEMQKLPKKEKIEDIILVSAETNSTNNPAYCLFMKLGFECQPIPHVSCTDKELDRLQKLKCELEKKFPMDVRQGMKISNVWLNIRSLFEHSLSIDKNPVATISYENLLTMTILPQEKHEERFTATIKNLYVYPQYRKKGYGQFLVISALQEMYDWEVSPRLTSVCAETNSTNNPAYCLFKKLGFQCEPIPHVSCTDEELERLQKVKSELEENFYK